jgi:cellulose biosynthesis protein BcsQ
VRSFVLFNNKGGVGKTTLTFHLAHMFARLGKRTVVLDYDPQCNLSSMFLEDEALFERWQDNSLGMTVAGCLDLVRRGKGEVVDPVLLRTSENLWILPGHLTLSRFEQPLAEEWPKKASQDNERALDVTTALDLLSNKAAAQVEADYVLLDLGPSLGALNRSALLSCDAVVLPLAPDLFSLQGMMNVGPTLREWREEWRLVRERYLEGRPHRALPFHEFKPLGYIVQQHLARADRPVQGHADWARKIPSIYAEDVLGEDPPGSPVDIEQDPNCIGTIKHFASLVPIAQQARKPIFDLKQADGIGGGQIQSVYQSRSAFEALARKLMSRIEELGSVA